MIVTMKDEDAAEFQALAVAGRQAVWDTLGISTRGRVAFLTMGDREWRVGLERTPDRRGSLIVRTESGSTIVTDQPPDDGTPVIDLP